jgi:tetratricopeptide (TPR) repeat protein
MFGPIILWFALQANPSPAALHMQAGVEAHRRGQFQEAIREFTQASQLNPNLPEAFLDLGEEYVQTHDYADAIVPLKRALELRPDLEQAHLDLGYALLSQGYPAEAIPHLERAHAIEALGVAQTEAGRYQEAIASLNAALAIHPNNPDLLYYLGRAGGLLSKHAMDTLIAAYPESARTHQAMGENYFVLRQMPQAESEFRAALAERPDIPNLHLELGLVYAGSAQWPKAEEEFRAETKVQPGNAEASYRLGSALLQQGKAHEAREELTRADHLKPDMPEILYSLGKAASLEGDATAAEKAWLHLLQIEKTTSLAAQAHFGLAAVYRKQGDAAKAQAEMREFGKLQKTVPQSDATPK